MGKLEVMVWGGTHPDEQLPLDVVQSLREQPIANVHTGIVNTLAPPGTRIVNVNMNHNAFPGDPDSEIPEVRLAAEVTGINKLYSKKIDMHSVKSAPGLMVADYGGVDLRRPVYQWMLGFFALCGLKNVVDLSNLNTMLAHSDGTISLEIDPAGERCNVSYWRELYATLANGTLPRAEVSDFTWYRWAADISVEQRELYGLPGRMAPFEEISAGQAEALGMPAQTAYALLCDPGGWCEAAQKIVPPYNMIKMA